MRGKKLLSLTVALSLITAGLAGCARNPAEDTYEEIPTPGMPVLEWNAPDGDSLTEAEGLWTLYLPAKNGLNLVAQHVPSVPGILRAEKMEAICRELLSYPANNQVDSLGGETELTLYGTNPVEFSGGVVTVNLGSSALGLSYRAFYTLSLALASTLCAIRAVIGVLGIKM